MRAFTLRSPMKKSLPTLHSFLMSSKDGVGPNDACAIPSPDVADILNAPPSLHTQPLLTSSSSFCLTFPPQPLPWPLCQLSSRPCLKCTSSCSKLASNKSLWCRQPWSTTLLSASHSHPNPYPCPYPSVSCLGSPAPHALPSCSKSASTKSLPLLRWSSSSASSHIPIPTLTLVGSAVLEALSHMHFFLSQIGQQHIPSPHPISSEAPHILHVRSTVPSTRLQPNCYTSDYELPYSVAIRLIPNYKLPALPLTPCFVPVVPTIPHWLPMHVSPSMWCTH